jgi:Domain of unknown function (DUF4157)
MSASAGAKGRDQKRSTQIENATRRSRRPAIPGAYSDVLALHQAVGNRAFATALGGKAGDLPASVRRVLRSGGEPLEPAVRVLMEDRFGADFGHVRIHTDSAAAASAEGMAANAFTLGSHIVLGAGRYAPGTQRGDRLLAHELTHVVQQSQPNAAGSPAQAEAEASASASGVVSGQHVQVQTAGAGIQCDEDEQARRERMEYLRKRIAEIDARVTGPVTQEYEDELKIERARLSHELAARQPATPQQAEAILNPGGVQQRKQKAYENFVNLPKGLQEDMQKWGMSAPEKPPVFWAGGTLPSPGLKAQAERVGRKANDENIPLRVAARKVEQEGSKPPPAVLSTDPTKRRQELNKLMATIGGKPVQDPNRKSTEWEKKEIEGAGGGKRNPQNWRTVYNPDTGDIVGYERESGGYYERRNVKGEKTHARENPMTEDATFLTRPDRELTPFERQHVFIEKDGKRNPDSYQPIYNKSTGQLVGYTTSASGLTRTYNTEGVVVNAHELGVEPSAVQLDDLLGVAALGKAVGKKVIGKAGQWIGKKAGEEIVEQGGKRLLTGSGAEVLEEVAEAELKKAGEKGAEELGEATVKRVVGEEAAELGGKQAVETGGKEAVELGGKEALETGAGQAGKAPAPFSPAPADVGDAAFKARMSRDVENVMRANVRNTVGSGGEAAAQASAHSTAMDLNAIKSNFPQLDTVSRETVASVKAFGVDKPLNASVIGRYDKELRALRSAVEPGVPTKLGQAADILATNRQAIQAAGAWPSGLAKNANPEQIAKFINRQGVLAIPADHVGSVRAAIAAKARVNPAAYGLTDGPGLEKGIERLTARVQSLGLTADEIYAINKKVLGIP